MLICRGLWATRGYLRTCSCIALVALAMFVCSCRKQASHNTAPAGPPTTAHIRFDYAIYYLPQPETDALAAARKLAGDGRISLKETPQPVAEPTERCVSFRLISNVKETYAPPGLDSLKYFGRGLSRQEALALQESKQSLVLSFSHPQADVWKGLRAANTMAGELARQTHGLVWDEQTREMFAPDEWDKRRVTSWTGDIPDLARHITIHAYKKTEYARAITLGMQKFGLPDVVVDDFSWSLNRPVGILINVLCQAMAEGAAIPETGEFDLDLHAIRCASVREPQLAAIKPKATATARLALQKGTHEEGDPQNRLIQIAFDRYPGPDVHARQEAMLDEMLGSEDSISYVKHNDAILAASQKARQQLPTLRQAFNDGLRPGEYILLKAPFATPAGGKEWMWVEVSSWDGKTIKGLLKNEPYKIPTLHAGQVVTVSQDDVFDYVRRHPDGTEEGNETAKLIEKANEK